jgi:hypothetical protein
VKTKGQVFLTSEFDGIVGLAYPKMAAYGLFPLFDNIIKQNKLASNVLGFYYNRKSNSDSSQLIVGDIDYSKIEGRMHHYDVIDKYYWTIKGDNILLDGKDMGLCGPAGCKLIVDTGTSLMTGPYDQLKKLLSKIEVDDECSQMASLPKIT